MAGVLSVGEFLYSPMLLHNFEIVVNDYEYPIRLIRFYEYKDDGLVERELIVVVLHAMSY
jgi:hypothetical protein